MGVYIGALGAIGSTGTKTVSGIPFEPVAVMFWNVVGELTPIGIMLGCATADDEQWVIWGGVDDEITSYTRKYNEGRTDCCILNKAAPFTTVAYQAEFLGFTSDGFQVDVVTYNTTGEDMMFMALGGNNINAAKAGSFRTGGSTGTEAVTGVGFEPKAVVVAHQLARFDLGTQGGNFKWGVGFATDSDQYSEFAAAEPASTHAHMHRTDEFACGIDALATFRMALDSMDSDGFTVDTTSASWQDQDFAYLAIDAAAAAVGNGTVPDSTGTDTISTPGFEPQGVFFTWNGANTPSTTGVRVNSVQVRAGAGAGSTRSGGNKGAGTVLRDNFPFGVYQVDGYQENSAVIMRGGGSGTGPNDNDVLAGGVVSATAMGSFDLTWGTAASGADRAYGWLALPGDLPFAWVPNIYRRVM